MANYNISSLFLVKYKEAWKEDSCLVIKQEYCKFGDLYDFLGKLEETYFKFTANFYWDLFFQMIIVMIFSLIFK
jgi:hypothetical protein